MSHAALEAAIEAAWEDRDSLNPDTGGATREAIVSALMMLDSGQERVATREADGSWLVHQWLKKGRAALVPYQRHGADPRRARPRDLVGQGTLQVRGLGRGGVDRGRLPRRAQLHRAPLGLYRAGCGADALLRQSRRLCRFSGTMVDTWATVGSCAQIGKNVHLSGGVGIGGVLEPMQAGPTIIEDNCFIGARSEVVEGVIVREGTVLGMGVYIGQSTKIVDRATGEIFMGEVPPYSVVVSGTMPGKPLPNGEPGPSLYCAVIVKHVDERTRSKTSINELLRD
jgi:2,3,4,5-tetrahydropyridine-2-carboxylate N-succinyltransferase